MTGKDSGVGISINYLRLEGRSPCSAQLPRSVSMLIKSFQVLYYDFLVVPSLDFMLEDKSSQKLMVPGVPFIENVDTSVEKTGFCHFYNHFMWLP